MGAMNLDWLISLGYNIITVRFARRSKLNRIMRIEQMLHNIDSNVKYRKMRNNLNILESKAFGSRYIRIGSPENLDRMIELRRYSKEMYDLIHRYKNGLKKYENRIEKLNLEKKQLQKELFSN
jgi:hypothetical protein